MNTATATTLTTRTGLVLTVRQATEADAPALEALFERVSAEDRRFRFFNGAVHVGVDQLDPLLHADHVHSESWLAFGADGELVASALLACDAALDTAEVAVSIASARRGQGVGWGLLDLLAREAEARGVRRVIAIEDRANHAAIELEREKGFVPEPFDGDPTLVVLSRTFR